MAARSARAAGDYAGDRVPYPTSPDASADRLRGLRQGLKDSGYVEGESNASTSREINAAFATFVRERPDALFVGLDPFLNSRRAQLVNLASRHALPATFSNRDNAEIGGLMSYGANIADAYRQVGVYTSRLLKGAKPADLPILQATKFEQRRKAEGEESPSEGKSAARAVSW